MSLPIVIDPADLSADHRLRAEKGVYVIYRTPEARDRAWACARGSYQRDILSGRYPISGAGLSGRAREWAGRYRASRNNLFVRMAARGLTVEEVRGKNGLRVLVLGERQDDD